MTRSKSDIESKRIVQAYERRKNNDIHYRYSFFNDGNCYISGRLEWETMRMLKRNGIHTLDEQRILDVGCGTGGILRDFIRYGANPANLYGIDLLDDRINMARNISPNINFYCGDASNLRYEDNYFDILGQFTVFTSILDCQMKSSIAQEMLRVLKEDGIILWYDFHVDNPSNPDVKGIKKKEIRTLFPGCIIQLKSITLAPPIARIIAPVSLILCNLLENMKILNTHYLGIIRK